MGRKLIGGGLLAALFGVGIFIAIFCTGGDQDVISGSNNQDSSAKIKESLWTKFLVKQEAGPAPRFPELSGILERADLVIIGEVVAHEQEMLPDWQARFPVGASPIDLASGEPPFGAERPHQVFDVLITHAIAGEMEAGDTVRVAQYGGVNDKYAYVYLDVGVHPLEVNETYGLFLLSQDEGHTIPLDPKQAIYPQNDAGEFETIWDYNPIAEEVAAMFTEAASS